MAKKPYKSLSGTDILTFPLMTQIVGLSLTIQMPCYPITELIVVSEYLVILSRSPPRELVQFTFETM